MSSEMREFGALDVENLRSLREVVAGTEHWAKVVSLDRAIALLARTEAGADRPVAEISELSGAKLIVLYSADEIGHLPKGTKLYTHASGDAEFSAAELESLAKCVLASVTPGGFHIPEGWNVLLDKLTAMQAKEAK